MFEVGLVVSVWKKIELKIVILIEFLIVCMVVSIFEVELILWLLIVVRIMLNSVVMMVFDLIFDSNMFGMIC